MELVILHVQVKHIMMVLHVHLASELALLAQEAHLTVLVALVHTIFTVIVVQFHVLMVLIQMEIITVSTALVTAIFVQVQLIAPPVPLLST